MSKSMDALDKMLLGEAPNETGNGGLEQDTAADVTESVTRKAGKVNADGADESDHTLLVTTANGATDQMEVDDKTKDTIKGEVKTSPKKRGADATVEGSPSPQKKRTISKAKNAKVDDPDATVVAEPKTPKKKAVTAKAKKAVADAADGQQMNKEDKDGVEPATPKKKRTPAKPKDVTPKAVTDNAEADNEDETRTTPKAKTTPSKSKGNDDGTPRKRAAASAIAPSRSIPSSWEDASDADKLLVKMKDEGSDWGAIRAAWKEATGQETGASTLPNRYNRIKVNMMRLKDGDDKLLLAAKDDIEHKFQIEKWALIATEMESKGADHYPTLFLQKMFKELSARPVENGVTTTTAATVNGAGEEDGAMADE